MLPGRFPTGVNVAIGDVNGDNYDDLIVSAGRGASPVVTALDGQEIATGVANPEMLFTFVAGGGNRAGARVAVGYVAPATVPSYQANLITTPEAGPTAGTVEVWNPADLAGTSGESCRGRQAGAAVPGQPMPSHGDRSFRLSGEAHGAVQIASNYLGRPGVPVLTCWIEAPQHRLRHDRHGKVATTQIRHLGAARD